MERIESHDGLMRTYKKPFPASHHDALDASDFILARYGKDGAIEPVQ